MLYFDVKELLRFVNQLKKPNNKGFKNKSKNQENILKDFIINNR